MPKEDAAKPEFWEKRFRESFTPWDAGRVPSALEQFLRTEPRGQRILIPGCGAGYEVRAFAEAGFDVLAIDFAPAAVERAQRTLGPIAHLVRLEDFFEFDFDRPFEIVETFYRADKYHYSVNLVRVKRKGKWTWKTEVETSA